jgi:hypothetical protein
MALRALAPASGGMGGHGGFLEAGGFSGGAPCGFPGPKEGPSMDEVD